MRVLLAGCDGYIGFPLAMHLLKQGHQVLGVDCYIRRGCIKEVKSVSGIPIFSMKDRARILTRKFGDFHFKLVNIATDYHKLKALFKKFKPESIVNLAQIPSAPYSMIDVHHAVKVQRNNNEGLLNLVWLMRKYAPNSHITTLGCYDDQTEILTENGWKLFKDLNPNEKVATRTSKNRTITFEVPISYHVYPYKGRMYYQKSQRIDLLVSPNHRMFTVGRGKCGYSGLRLEFIPQIIGRDRVYDIGFNWTGEDRTFFNVNNRTIRMDDWLDFFGWYISEGHVPNRKNRPNSYGTYIRQTKSEHKKNLVKSAVTTIAKQLGLNATLDDVEGKYIVWGKELAMYLKQFGNSSNKYIPKEIKQLSTRQLQILLESLINGDGNEHRRGRTWRYYSKSKQLADDVQEIALKCGYSANVTSKGDGWQVNICITTFTHVNHGKQTDGWKDYDGLVYCVHVSSGIVFVRRNGKPMWCGQTMGEYEQPNMPIPEGFFYVKYREMGDVLEFPRLGGSFYHLSKTQSTKNLHYACRTWDITGTDIHQGVVYGTTTEEMGNPPKSALRTRFDFDEVFGTMINRACACAVIGHPLIPYGTGEQTRAYIALRDSIRCLTISVENPPNESDSIHCYRVINQFDESYSCNEVARKVQELAHEFGLLSEIKHIPNPRVEKEIHYYNPEHQKLYNLGWRPTHTLKEELEIMLEDLAQFKKRINKYKRRILPTVHWR